MSVDEIIEAIERLTPAERHQVQAAADRLLREDIHAALTKDGVCTGGSGRLEPFEPLPIYLDPPLSQTIIDERGWE